MNDRLYNSDIELYEDLNELDTEIESIVANIKDVLTPEWVEMYRDSNYSESDIAASCADEIVHLSHQLRDLLYQRDITLQAIDRVEADVVEDEDEKETA